MIKLHGKKISAVTVFCSSGSQVSPTFFAEMEVLARGLAEAGITIVYGGACLGLMGHLADVALRHGGDVFGVIPECFNKEGIVHPGLSRVEVVSHLLDRKRIMAEHGDAAIVFPGGLGTLDEATELLALKQIGEYPKPVVFLNYLDFWQPLFGFMQELQEQKMISQKFSDLFITFDSAQEVVNFCT